MQESRGEIVSITYRELYEGCCELLTKAQVPDAKIDAWLLLEYCFQISRTGYFLQRDKKQTIACDMLEQFYQLSQKRAQRIPLQYLLGMQGFMGLDFLVTPSVLIPRADTETLVECVLRDYKGKKDITLLDVCTGSGCIAVSLGVYGAFSAITASDLSEDALKIAAKNAQMHHIPIRFVKSDLFQSIDGNYDVIVSNPPYIVREVIQTLEPEVKDHEPYMALDGGVDGLDFYRKLIESAVQYLKKDGRLYLEIGYDQAKEVSALLKKNAFEAIQVVKDLAGNDRVVCAKKGENYV